MSRQKVLDICSWEAVEDLTRKGTMADKVIDEIVRHMWSPSSGLRQGVFLAFGGGSIVFDSPLPKVLRMNTYCQDDDAETGIDGGEHAEKVENLRGLEDAVWSLLARAFDDLCDIDQYCTDSEFMQHVIAGDVIPFVAKAFVRYPKNSVFLELWFGESIAAKWLGEGLIYISSLDGDVYECNVMDAPELIASAIFNCYRDYYRKHQTRKMVS